jgi:hypothetical protein
LSARSAKDGGLRRNRGTTGMLRAIIGFLALLGALSTARAAGGPFEDSIYGTPAEARWAPFHANYANVPACDNPAVLSTISWRFDQTENIYWGGVHAIDGYERVREIGFRSDGIDYIPRRYCVARALIFNPRIIPMEQRKARTVVYNVGAAEGILGLSWGVDWCVVGLDRELAYAPACLALRPVIERRIGVLKEVNWFGEYGLKARY